MTKIDILLSYQELQLIEDWICRNLGNINLKKDKETYNAVVSLTTIISDLINYKYKHELKGDNN